MKKIIFKHSDPELKTIKGSDGEDIPIEKGLKIVLGVSVAKAQVNVEDFRKWVKVGTKIDEAKDEVLLEDAEFELLQKLFKGGVDQAFPVVESKGLAVEVDRILTEATEVENTKPEASEGK